jgi:hypothetical protein
LSWASSAAFIDGAKINLQVEKKHWPYQRLKARGNEAWDVQQNTKASIENYSKDGLSILIRLLQMWQVMKEWNIQGLYFVDGNLKKIYG